MLKWGGNTHTHTHIVVFLRRYVLFSEKYSMLNCKNIQRRVVLFLHSFYIITKTEDPVSAELFKALTWDIWYLLCFNQPWRETCANVFIYVYIFILPFFPAGIHSNYEQKINYSVSKINKYNNKYNTNTGWNEVTAL